jgi:amino acid transporter
VFENTLISEATGCISFAANILNAIKPGLDKTANEWIRRGIAIAAVSAVVLCHAFTPKVGVRIMNALSTLKILTLVFIILTGWVVLGGNVRKIPDPGASFRQSFKGSRKNLNSYVTALFKVTFSFAG